VTLTIKSIEKTLPVVTIARSFTARVPITRLTHSPPGGAGVVATRSELWSDAEHDDLAVDVASDAGKIGQPVPRLTKDAISHETASSPGFGVGNARLDARYRVFA